MARSWSWFAAGARRKPIPVLILFDTGGVRLQEANASEPAIGEVDVALIEYRRAGASGSSGWSAGAGCYGGGG